MKRAALLVLALTAALVVIPSTAASACSCASPPTAELVSRADVVVRGVVGAPVAPDEAPVSSATPVRYAVTVREAFKGEAVPRLTVTSARDGASCGIEVVPGREYVVFATAHAGGLETGQCGGTAPAGNELVADIESVTGPGRPTVALVPTSPAPRAAAPTGVASDRRTATSTLSLLGLAVLVALGAGSVTGPRRRRT